MVGISLQFWSLGRGLHLYIRPNPWDFTEKSYPHLRAPQGGVVDAKIEYHISWNMNTESLENGNQTYSYVFFDEDSDFRTFKMRTATQKA